MKKDKDKDKDPSYWAWLRPGVKVDYHAVIGGPITSYGVTVFRAPWQMASGHWVVSLKEETSVVSIDALTPHTETKAEAHDRVCYKVIRKTDEIIEEVATEVFNVKTLPEEPNNPLAAKKLNKLEELSQFLQQWRREMLQ
jgi:hypothetical protein